MLPIPTKNFLIIDASNIMSSKLIILEQSQKAVYYLKNKREQARTIGKD